MLCNPAEPGRRGLGRFCISQRGIRVGPRNSRARISYRPRVPRVATIRYRARLSRASCVELIDHRSVMQSGRVGALLRVHCLYHHEEGSAWTQKYLRELQRLLPPTDDRLRAVIIETLIAIFQKRRSQLHSSDESKELQLPPPLVCALEDGGKGGMRTRSG
jgi:hypothetical protein